MNLITCRPLQGQASISKDGYDQFDLYNYDGETWRVLKNAAHVGREVTDEGRSR
jgi:hypothetical protein